LLADEEKRTTAGVSKVAKRNAARRARKAAAAAAEDAAATSVDAAVAQLEAARLEGNAQGRGERAVVMDGEAMKKRLRALRKKVRLAAERVEVERVKGSERTAEIDAKLTSITEWCAHAICKCNRSPKDTGPWGFRNCIWGCPA
jgi:hypothetical protein